MTTTAAATTTRSQRILALLSENFGDVVAPYGMGAIGALGVGTIGSQIRTTHKQTAEKIHQSGMGSEHTKAKKDLLSLRKKHVLTLGTNRNLATKIRDQKTRVRDIENKGLERFHRGVA